MSNDVDPGLVMAEVRVNGGSENEVTRRFENIDEALKFAVAEHEAREHVDVLLASMNEETGYLMLCLDSNEATMMEGDFV